MKVFSPYAKKSFDFGKPLNLSKTFEKGVNIIRSKILRVHKVEVRLCTFDGHGGYLNFASLTICISTF